jgi:hypothetical protein
MGVIISPLAGSTNFDTSKTASDMAQAIYIVASPKYIPGQLRLWSTVLASDLIRVKAAKVPSKSKDNLYGINFWVIAKKPIRIKGHRVSIIFFIV